MRRGDIRWVNLDPVVGSEASKRRPAIIVSNDATNAVTRAMNAGLITIVPLTSSVSSVYPFEVFVDASDSGLARNSKAQAQQVRSISVQRIGEVIGHLTPALMNQVDEALRIHLGL
jgi:mRNA interferase MazF